MEDDDVAALGCIAGLLMLWHASRSGTPDEQEVIETARQGFTFARECRRQAENLKL